jgi:hypothetical protein
MPSGDTKGKNVVEFSIDELVDTIVKAGDGWTVNHAHKCYPPLKDGDFKRVINVTDVVKSTVDITRLSKEEIR